MGNVVRERPIDRQMMLRDMLQAYGASQENADTVAFGGSHLAPPPGTTTSRPPADTFEMRQVVAGAYTNKLVDILGEDPETAGILEQLDDEEIRAIYQTQDAPRIHQAIMDARIASRNARVNASIELAQVANDTHGFKEKLKERAGIGLQFVLGAAEPLTRFQQMLYGFMSGEDWSTATRRLYEKVVVDQGTQETSPFIASWHALRGGERELEILAQANQAYYNPEHFLEFRDVLDNQLGEDKMDEFYSSMYEGGPLGKAAMALVAGGYAAAEIFLDPLVLLSALPTKAVGAARRLPSTVTRAVHTAERARRTQRLNDLATARTAASEHLDRAAQAHRLENTAESANNLKMAMRNLAEREDDVLRYQMAGEVDTHIVGTGRSNPKVVETTAIETTTHRAWKGEKAIKPAITRRQIIRTYHRALEAQKKARESGMFEKLPGSEQYYSDWVKFYGLMLDEWDRGVRPADLWKGSGGFGAGALGAEGAATEVAGVLPHLRRFHLDLTNIRKTLVQDRAALPRGQRVELTNQIKEIDEYIMALEQRRDGVVPPYLEFTSQHKRPRTVDEIRHEMMQDRLDALDQPSTNHIPFNTRQMSLFDPQEGGELAARVALGADEGESASTALAYLVDGATIDDVMMPLTGIPEYSAVVGGRIVPGTMDNALTDPITLAARVNKMKRAADRKTWVGKKGEEGPAQRTLLDQLEDQIKRGELDKSKYDDSWLPAPRKTTRELMEDGWYEEYGKTFFDRIAPGLYGNWQVPLPSVIKAAAYHLREPVRVFETMDPGVSANLLRRGTMNAEAETNRLRQVFAQNLEDFGAITQHEPAWWRTVLETDPRRAQRVTDDLNESLFDILNTPRGTPEYGALTAKLSATQLKAVENIRYELDILSGRLGIYGTDKYIDGYIHHAFDKDWFLKGSSPPEMRGLSRKGNLILGFMLDRTGVEGFERSAVDALELYARGVSRKLHVEPMMKQLKERANFIAQSQGEHWYPRYVDMVISQLSGEPSMLGKLVDHVVGGISATAGVPYQPGAATRTLMGVTSLIYGSLLTGNRRYPVMNIATNIATSGAEFGLFRTIKGMMMMATPEGQQIFRNVGGDKMWLKLFDEDAALARLTKSLTGLRAGTISIQDTENFIRGTSFWASLDLSLNKMGFRSIQEAHQAGFGHKMIYDALRRTEEVNHFFGVAAKPPIFSRVSRTGAAMGTQFLSFGPKQTELLFNMAKDNPGKIGSYLMLSGWISRVAATELGMDISDYVGFGYARSYGVREHATPAFELMANLADAMGQLTRLGMGHGNAIEAQRAVDEALKSAQNLIPLATAVRSHMTTMEAMDTGMVGTPGVGHARPADVEVANIAGIQIPYNAGPKGKRGEGFAMTMGTRSMEARAHSDARREVSNIEATAALERLALSEKAYQAMQRGDMSEMRAQLQRMIDMGIPVGDINSDIEARHKTQLLYWYYRRIEQNPELLHQIVPALQRHGILGGQ